MQFKLKARNIRTAIMEHRLEETKSKRNRRRKTFYDEVSDIGVTVPVYFYADGFRTERDFDHFRMHRYVEERKLTEPQSSLDRDEILDLEEARQAEIVLAYYEREGNFWKAKIEHVEQKKAKKGKKEEKKEKKRVTAKE